MEAKGEKHIRVGFYFVLLCLFAWVFASSMLLEIYWGNSYYNYVRRQGREKREDEIFSALREGTNGIRCGQQTHFRIII